MVHFRNFESGLFPTTLRKRKLQLLPRSAPEESKSWSFRLLSPSRAPARGVLLTQIPKLKPQIPQISQI